MILILIGPPGGGKGTQADMLAERQGYRKLSTGDTLRKQVKLGTDLGKTAESFMSSGKLVPDDIIMKCLASEISSQGEKLILDGFPRNMAQAQNLESVVGDYSKVRVIVIDVDNEEVVQRISGRRVCSICTTNYHVKFSKPKKDGFCDKCGGAVIQRSDDDASKVQVRLEVYRKETKPIIDFLSKKCVCNTIKGSGDIEDIYKKVAELLK